MRSFILCGVFALLGVCFETAAQSPPETKVVVSMQGVFSELTQAQLECVFQDTPYVPSFRAMPLARAQLNLLKGRVDGYFGIAQNPDIEQVAELSAPLLVKKWNRYSYDAQLLELPLSDPRLRIGVIDSGNPMQWLLAQGVEPTIKAQSQAQLLALLNKQRVNQIITDEKSLNAVLHGRSAPPQRFLRFAALSVYFSHEFLRQHDDFLTTFERAAEHCSVSPPELEEAQRTVVMQLASEYFQHWSQQPAWLQALDQAANMPVPVALHLQRLDARWLRERTARRQPLIEQVLNTPLSQQLQQAVAQDHRLGEVMLTDKYGQLLAASGITSDFYQGDELAFQQSQHLARGQLMLEPISYDSSTRQFSVKVSGPLFAPQGKEFLGVLTLGVNIDQLF